MTVSNRFDVPPGELVVKYTRNINADPAGIRIEFEFKSSHDGKLYLLDLDEKELAKYHGISASNISAVIDLISNLPHKVGIHRSHYGKTIARVIYFINIEGRARRIIFDLSSIDLKPLADETIIDLKPLADEITIHANQRDEIKGHRAEDVVGPCEDREGPCEDREGPYVDRAKQIVQVPFDKLVVSNAAAHEYMKIPGVYLFDEYRQHMESRGDIDVDRIINAFFNDGDMRLMFNMHYLNRIEGLDFIKAAEISYGWKSSHSGTRIYGLVGWEQSGFIFETKRTKKIRSYFFARRQACVTKNGGKGFKSIASLMVGVRYSRFLVFESGTLHGLTRCADDLRFLLGKDAYACMIIQT